MEENQERPSGMGFFSVGRTDADFKNLGHGIRWANTRPRIECADGFSVSVQAGEYLYSSPREDAGPWTAVECGFPSDRPEPWEATEDSEGWAKYAEDVERPCDTVYGWVPLPMVQALIDRHGGEA